MKKETGIKLRRLIERLIREESTDLKSEIIRLYKSGKSQAEISDELDIDIMKVASYTKHLGKQVGKDDFNDDRIGDDPSSKQYYDRVMRK